MSTLFSRTLMVFLMLICITSCTEKIIKLPYKAVSQDCNFHVSDSRPDPNNLYSNTGLQISLVPTLKDSIQSSLCNNEGFDSAKNSSFEITDFSCVISPHMWSITYLVEIRGLLTLFDGSKVTVSGTNKFEDAETKGCGKTLPKAIEDLRAKILKLQNELKPIQ